MGEALNLSGLDALVSASERAHRGADLGSEAGFTDGNGADVRPPDRVEYRFGARRGRLVIVFHDGDAYVRFDGDAGNTLVKWCHLAKVPAWADDPGAGGEAAHG